MSIIPAPQPLSPRWTPPSPSTPPPSSPQPPAQSIWMLVSPLITARPTCYQGCCHRSTSSYRGTAPTQLCQPNPQSACSVPGGTFLPPHQAGCLHGPHPHPSLSAYPQGGWGRGPWSLQGLKEQPGCVHAPGHLCLSFPLPGSPHTLLSAINFSN